MWFAKPKHRTPVRAALRHAHAVVAVFDAELLQLTEDLETPADVEARVGAGRHPDVEARVEAGRHPDLKALEASVIALEQTRAEAMTEAEEWLRRSELAAAAGRGDLAAQARNRAAIATAAATAYALEIDAGRAFLNDVAEKATGSACEG